MTIRRGTADYEAGLPEGEIARRVEVWNHISIEDRTNLERLQRGFGSRHPPRGPLGPPHYEGTLFDFYQYLAGALGSDSSARDACAAGLL